MQNVVTNKLSVMCQLSFVRSFIRSSDIERCLSAQSSVSRCVLVSAYPLTFIFVIFDVKSFGAAAFDLSIDEWKRGRGTTRTHTQTRPNQNFEVFGNRFPQMLHEFGGNQKFFYQNKVHNFSFLLFKALRFFFVWLLGFFSFCLSFFCPLYNIDFSGGCMLEWLLFAYRKTFCLPKNPLQFI